LHGTSWRQIGKGADPSGVQGVVAAIDSDGRLAFAEKSGGSVDAKYVDVFQQSVLVRSRVGAVGSQITAKIVGCGHSHVFMEKKEKVQQKRP
jgi:hypothetical protein